MKLTDREWKAFRIGDVFSSIAISKSADFGRLMSGQTAFVGRTGVNNGIQEFFHSALTLQDYESLIRNKYSKQVSVLIVSRSEVTTNLQKTGAHYC